MILLIYTILLLMYLLVFIFVSYTVYAIIKGAPFIPTQKKNVRIMIEIANPQKNETLMDLGSGDGRIVHLAAKTGCKCIGIEINPLLFWWSSFKTKFKRLKNVQIIRQNLWKTDLSDIDILTLFFIAPKMDRLHKKILKEMKLGSRVVSYGFSFPDWKYMEKRGRIYLYKV